MIVRRLLLAVAMAAAAVSSAGAQTVDDVVRGTVLTGWRSDAGTHVAALRLDLAPGWKTYWRAPGDAGIPPSFDWAGSDNVAGVRMHWPVPGIFEQNGLRSVGYEGGVTLPIEIAVARPGEPVSVSGRMELGVCLDICIPATLSFVAVLPPGAGSHVDEIRAALSDRPMSATEAGVGRVVCTTEPIADGLRLTVRVEMPRLAGDEAAVVEFADPAVWVAEPAVSRAGPTLTAVTEMVPPGAAPFALSRQDVRITVLGGGRGVDIRGCTGS